MNKFLLFVSVVSLTTLLTLSNCATIVSKTSYPLIINSNPTSARVSILDKHGKEVFLGNTPANVVLKSGAGFFSKAEYRVKFSMDGYQDKIVMINSKLNGWYFGNIIFGGVIGLLIVDPATGAMWKIETEFLSEKMEKATASNNPELRIMNINEVPESWRTHLVKIN